MSILFKTLKKLVLTVSLFLVANAWLRSVDQAFRRPCGLRNDNYNSLDLKHAKYENDEDEDFYDISELSEIS